jgi:hypothetical protein
MGLVIYFEMPFLVITSSTKVIALLNDKSDLTFNEVGISKYFFFSSFLTVIAVFS